MHAYVTGCWWTVRQLGVGWVGLLWEVMYFAAGPWRLPWIPDQVRDDGGKGSETARTSTTSCRTSAARCGIQSQQYRHLKSSPCPYNTFRSSKKTNSSRQKLIPPHQNTGHTFSHAYVTGCWRTVRQLGVGWAGLLWEVTYFAAGPWRLPKRHECWGGRMRGQTRGRQHWGAFP